VRPRDLAGYQLIVVADVSARIAPSVFELDLEAHPELLDVESGALPVDTDPLTDIARLFRRKISLLHGPKCRG
jgi:hypothetical protein